MVILQIELSKSMSTKNIKNPSTNRILLKVLIIGNTFKKKMIDNQAKKIL